MTLREEIETALQPLIGKPISGMHRAGGMQIFGIGERTPGKNRRGKDIIHSELGLHVCCDWHIDRNGLRIFGSEDFGPYPERRDEKAQPFYDTLGSAELTITAVKGDDSGGVIITMAGGYTLHVETDLSVDPEEPDIPSEQWRFLPKDGQHHFVITAEGVERY